MTVPTRVLRFDVNESDGTPIQGAICTAQLNVADVYEEEVVDKVLESTTTDALGEASLNLFPNVLGDRGTVYLVIIRHPTTNRAILKTVIRMPDADVDLADILGNGVEGASPASVPGIANLVGPGIVVKRADSSYAMRTIVGTTNQVNVASGTGDDANPTLSLPQDIHTGASPTFAALTLAGALTVATVLAGDGTVLAPAYSFSGQSNTGLYRDGSNLVVAAAGARYAAFGSGGVYVDVNSLIVRDGTGVVGATLTTPAASQHILEMRSGANGQSLRIYKTYTDASNYERFAFNINSVPFTLQEEIAGTGAYRGIDIRALQVRIGNAASLFWTFQNTGHLIAITDNITDIGANGASRPRSAYFGTSVKVGDNLILTDTGGTATVNNSGGSFLVLQSGVANLQVRTAGGEQFRVTNTAVAVNYLQVSGNVTGSRPVVTVDGSDANIGMFLSTKGTGSFSFVTSTGGAEQFRITHTASAVNFVSTTGAATGSQVNIGADGTDANINFRAYTKGSGQFEVITNGQSGSRQFVVAHTASAVNYLQAEGAPTGSGVRLSAQGSDAAVTLNLASRGAGQISLNTNNTTVQMVVAHVASAVNYVMLQGGATGSPGTVTVSAQGSDSNVHLNLVAKGTGVVQSAGTAVVVAGKNAIPIPAAAITPRSANGCAALATTNGAANQPDIPYLAFDGAAKEYAGFLMQMPKGWNESTITAQFCWRRASGTGAANVVWGIRAVAVSDNDTPAATFGSDATVTDDAKTTTANFSLSGETGACTIGGTPAEGDLVFFEVFRDGASGSDTLDAVDAWLTAVNLFITTNAPNDA